MDSNPIHHPSAANKMKCFFLDYVQFWWSARLVDGLKPHLPPFSRQKNEMLIFLLCSTSDDWPGWSMDSNPIHHSSPAKKNEMLIFGLRSTSDDLPGWLMNLNLICHPSPTKKMKCSIFDYVQLLKISQADQLTQSPSASPLQPKKWNTHFWITFNFWWSAGLVNGLKPHPPPLSSQKNEMLIFVLHSTSDVGQTGQWTWTSSTTPLQPKNEMLIFWLCSTSDDQLGWSVDSNPIHHPFTAKKMKCSFLYYIQLLMLARLVNGLKPHPPPLCSQKNEMLLLWITLNFWWLAGLSDGLKPHPPPLSSQKKWNAHFWITFISDDLPGWLMNLNLICHPSPTKKMKCSIFDYVKLLMISQADQLTQIPSASPLQPKKWNAHFWITFNFWWSAGLVNGLKPHPPPLSSQKNEMLIFVLHSTCDVGQTGQWTWTSSTTPLHPKNEMLIFWLCSTSDDELGWSMDSIPICQPSPAKKIKCYFLDYVQLLMISWAGQWTQTPSISSLQPKKWNTPFCIMFNF